VPGTSSLLICGHELLACKGCSKKERLKCRQQRGNRSQRPASRSGRGRQILISSTSPQHQIVKGQPPDSPTISRPRQFVKRPVFGVARPATKPVHGQGTRWSGMLCPYQETKPRPCRLARGKPAGTSLPGIGSVPIGHSRPAISVAIHQPPGRLSSLCGPAMHAGLVVGPAAQCNVDRHSGDCLPSG